MVSDAREALRTYRRILLRLATGGGKTIVAAQMIRLAAAKGKRVWFVCHRDFLLRQTAGTLSDIGIDFGYAAAGYPWSPRSQVLICSIGTIANRLKYLEQPDLIFWDESHHLAAATWAKIAHWATKAYHVGLSATPCRRDGKPLRAFFDHMIFGPPESWLMDEGFLSHYEAYAPGGMDLTGGDASPKIIGDVVENFARLSRGRLGIGFAPSIEKSKETVERFKNAGIIAVHIDADTPDHERRQICRAYARHEIQFLCNVWLFGEGFDLAAHAGMPVTIDVLSDFSLTSSLSLHRQKLGRVLRPKDNGGIATLIDHTGGLLNPKLGLPDTEIEWSLDGKAKPKNSVSSVNLRKCPECHEDHDPAPKCPKCGHVYTVERRQIEEIGGELIRINTPPASEAKSKITPEQVENRAAKDIAELIEIAKKRKYSSPEAWARNYYNAREAKRRATA